MDVAWTCGRLGDVQYTVAACGAHETTTHTAAQSQAKKKQAQKKKKNKHIPFVSDFWQVLCSAASFQLDRDGQAQQVIRVAQEDDLIEQG